MNKLSTKLFGGFIIVLLGAVLFFSLSGGEKAPEITVKASDGQNLQLNQPNKPVLVNFWATSCPSCVSKMPSLAELKNALGDRFELLSISMDYDPATQVDAFIKAHDYPFNFIKDTDGSLSQAFGDIKLTPTTFLIAPNGNIVYRKIGDTDMTHLRERIEKLSPQL